MPIWFQEYTLKDFEQFNTKNIHHSLAIEFTEIREESLSASMPVDERTIQPAGILHGGASVVLAESLGSVGSNLIVDPTEFYCVGQSINANHIRPVKSGKVVGTATPIHIGKTSHIWSIEIKNEQNKLVCICRLTMAVLKR
ncbi:MAG: hotdog fold thioesterase [Flavobacteriales bacterium]|nr:hotdog fold thioesterase [Flavobacteriales bacterium]